MSLVLNQYKNLKLRHYRNLKSETMGKLINRIPGLCLDVKFTKLGIEKACWIARQDSKVSTSVLKALPGKPDIKRHSPSILKDTNHPYSRNLVAQLVECQTGDRRVTSWILTDCGVPVLCPWARHFIHCLVLVQPRKTGNRSNITEMLLSGT